MAADSLTTAGQAPGPGAAGSGGRPAKRALRARRRGRIGLIFAIMSVIAVVMLYPFWYILNNAFRNQSQFERQSGHSGVAGASCCASCRSAGNCSTPR